MQKRGVMVKGGVMGEGRGDREGRVMGKIG